MDPLGHRGIMNFELDFSALIFTYCFLEVKKDLNQESVIPRVMHNVHLL